jgi:hypothetical protein
VRGRGPGRRNSFVRLFYAEAFAADRSALSDGGLRGDRRVPKETPYDRMKTAVSGEGAGSIISIVRSSILPGTTASNHSLSFLPSQDQRQGRAAASVYP